MRIAEFIEIEQFRRQRFAAGMALTFVLVDTQPQLGGFRHSTKLPLCRRLRAFLLNAATGHDSRFDRSRRRAVFVVVNYRHDYNIAVNTNLDERAWRQIHNR
jgi:hypothetical protein